MFIFNSPKHFFEILFPLFIRMSKSKHIIPASKSGKNLDKGRNNAIQFYVKFFIVNTFCRPFFPLKYGLFDR